MRTVKLGRTWGLFAACMLTLSEALHFRSTKLAARDRAESSAPNFSRPRTVEPIFAEVPFVERGLRRGTIKSNHSLVPGKRNTTRVSDLKPTDPCVDHFVNEQSFMLNASEIVNFDLEMYLDSVSSCISHLQFLLPLGSDITINTPLASNAFTKQLLQAILEIVAGGIAGDFLYVGPREEPGVAIIHEVLQHARSTSQCPAINAERNFYALDDDEIHSNRHGCLLRRHAFVLLGVQCSGILLDVLGPVIREGGTLFVQHDTEECNSVNTSYLSVSSESPRVYVRKINFPSFGEVWDALMLSSIQAMISTNWTRSFKGMGHIGEVWEEVREVSVLVSSVSITAHICEIGFNAGHSALVILSSQQNNSLTSFDLSNLPWSKHAKKRIEMLFPGRFELISGHSTVTVPEYIKKIVLGQKMTCDIFLVDGDHSYRGALLDFHNAIESMSTVGFLFADDHSTSFPGVVRAWNDIVGEGLISTVRCEKTRGYRYGFKKGWCIGQHKPKKSWPSLGVADIPSIHVAITFCGTELHLRRLLEMNLKSIVMASTPQSKIHVHLITDKAINSPFLLQMVKNIACAGLVLELHPAPLYERGISHFEKCSMDRLALPELLPNIDCVLYIDLDALVLGSMEKIHDKFCTLDKKLISAVPEGKGWYTKKHELKRKGITYVPNTGINAGVLGMNLKEMRGINFTEKMLSLVDSAPFLKLGDQDLLNLYFANRTHQVNLLDPRYNFRMANSHAEIDCGSLELEVVENCKTYSSVFDALVLHGNRNAFQKNKYFIPVWRSFSDLELLPHGAPCRTLKGRQEDWEYVNQVIQVALKSKITMVSKERLENVRDAAWTVISNSVEGDFVETGTWKGGCSIVMRAVNVVLGGIDDRKNWLFDTFEGLPTFDKRDRAIEAVSRKPMDPEGSYKFQGGVATVKNHFLRILGDNFKNLEFRPGLFKDTLPSANITKIAVLRLDGDMYSSTMDVLDVLYDKVVSGGYVIIDDYGHWPQCQKAIHDFFDTKRGIDVAKLLKKVDYTAYYFVKP